MRSRLVQYDMPISSFSGLIKTPSIVPREISLNISRYTEMFLRYCMNLIVMVWFYGYIMTNKLIKLVVSLLCSFKFTYISNLPYVFNGFKIRFLSPGFDRVVFWFIYIILISCIHGGPFFDDFG